MMDYEEETEFPTKKEFGSLERKRRAIRKEHYKLIRLAGMECYYCGVYYVDRRGECCEKDEAVRIKRFWRGKRSRLIKKNCNRQFRRQKALRMLISNKRGLYRKSTEFWWALD